MSNIFFSSSHGRANCDVVRLHITSLVWGAWSWPWLLCLQGALKRLIFTVCHLGRGSFALVTANIKTQLFSSEGETQNNKDIYSFLAWREGNGTQGNWMAILNRYKKLVSQSLNWPLELTATDSLPRSIVQKARNWIRRIHSLLAMKLIYQSLWKTSFIKMPPEFLRWVCTTMCCENWY